MKLRRLYFTVSGTCMIMTAFMIMFALSPPAIGGAQAPDFPAITNSPNPEGWPNRQYRLHRVGRVAMTVTNRGTLGTGFVHDPICDGEECPSCEYPAGSGLNYLFSTQIWVGAVSGTDTLVSVGADGWSCCTWELNPDAGIAGTMIARSNDPADSNFSPAALSNLEYLAACTDTFTDAGITGTDVYDQRHHIPLNIRIDQASYSWRGEDIDDFILFEYHVTNIGDVRLKDVYIGIHFDGDVYHVSNEMVGHKDDIAGFLMAEEIAYIIDNDGDPESGIWTDASPRGAIGIKIHEISPDPGWYSFNWWASNGDAPLDFGPRLAGTLHDPFRPFNGHLGTPTGDPNKYYVLRHPEFDYDQLYTAINHTVYGFLPPPPTTTAVDIADGADAQLLLSFGRFDIDPGDSVTFFFSIILGDSVHVAADDFAEYFDPFHPQAYHSKLDFSRLTANARAADSVFDVFRTPTAVDGDARQTLPERARLVGNYPNPFNPSTIIEYSLPRQSQVQLTVYDLLGSPVVTLVDAVQPAGTYSIRWDGRDTDGRPAATGIYFYRLKTDSYSEAKKMLLLK